MFAEGCVVRPEAVLFSLAGVHSVYFIVEKSCQPKRSKLHHQNRTNILLRHDNTNKNFSFFPPFSGIHFLSIQWLIYRRLNYIAYSRLSAGQTTVQIVT